MASDLSGELKFENISAISSLDEISIGLKKLSADQARQDFQLATSESLLKTTVSLCEECLQHAKAAVFECDNKVWIKSHCEEHQFSINLLENDARFYRLSNKDKWGVKYAKNREFFIPEFANCCGPNNNCSTKPAELKVHHLKNKSKFEFTDQINNKSCTVLIEITNACNMSCRVCYADASGDRILPYEQFKIHVEKLLVDKTYIDSVQVTGGEATIHPAYWEMLNWLNKQQNIGLIYLPTNGLEVSKPDFVKKLKPLRKKVLILLQFDGSQTKTNQALRRADTLKNREQVITLLSKNKICMQLTMTVAHQLSETEINWVVKQGLKHKHIRLIGFLPTFYTGRYQLAHNGKERPTLSTVAHAIAKALPEKVGIDDFMPIPCSHPNCGWTSLFARRFGLFFNITQKLDMESVMNDVAYKTVLDKNEIQSALGQGKNNWIKRLITIIGKKIIRPADIFGVAIKPFMDQYNYDMDRVSNCCHHILNTKGELVSFCEYNNQIRAKDSWNKFPNIYGKHEKTALAVKRRFND